MEVPEPRVQDGVVQLDRLSHGSRVPLLQLGPAFDVRQHQRQGLPLACAPTRR